MEKKKPQRKCVGCKAMKDKQDIVRIVCSPTGEFLLDSTGKANGRGAYLCANTDCLQLAKKSKGLERSFKRAVPQEIYVMLQDSLTT